jgi:hypothetical protein
VIRDELDKPETDFRNPIGDCLEILRRG